MILGSAAYLRLDGLGEPSLWLDEILHVEKTQEAAGESWRSWLRGVSADRENGSLYYATQLVALQLFDGELAVRLMPALAGLATVLLIYLVTLSATGNRKVAAVASALLAVSPLHVYYSREGRPYAAVMFLAMLLLLLALEHQRPWTKAAVYGVCVATAYLGALAAPLLICCAALAGFEWLRHRGYGHFLLAALTGMAIGLLLFPTVERLGTAVGTFHNTARWEITSPLSRLTFDRLLASLSVSGTDRGTSGGLSFLFLALAIWGGICLARRKPQPAFWVTGLSLLPIASWLTALVALGHWYNVRYTSVGLPAFLILVSVGLVNVWDGAWQQIRRRLGRRAASGPVSLIPDALLVAVLVVLLAPVWRTARAEPFEKPDWRGVAELIGSLAAPGEPVIARGPWSEICIRFYLRQLHLPLEVFAVNYDPARAAQLTLRYPRAWVLSAGYRETPEFDAWTRGLDPILSTHLANLRLFFFPDFPTLLSEPSRIEKLAAVLTQDQKSLPRQDFTDQELLLGTGWSYPETAPDGTSFRWAKADRAQIALPAPLGGGARALRLRLMPFPSSNRPPQAVTVTIGSEPLGRLVLEPGWNEISLPSRRGNPAIDIVTFEFSWRQSPRELDPGSQDPRHLAVAFDFVEALSVPAASSK